MTEPCVNAVVMGWPEATMIACACFAAAFAIWSFVKYA